MLYLKKILFIIFIIFPLCIFATEGDEKKEIIDITFVTDSKNYEYQMETARTALQKKQGLMFRTQLLPQKGMIFIYEKAQKVGIWMKNTIIPLDILFITCNYAIEKIVNNRQPNDLEPVFSNGKICYIAEIAGGDAQKMRLNAGNKVMIKESGVRQ